MSNGSNSDSTTARRGEIWLFDPNPVRGREQGNVRPGVIVSNDAFNQAGREIVTIVPMTGTRRDSQLYPYHVPIEPEASGLSRSSVAMCEQVRSISVSRLLGRSPRGNAEESTMQQIEERLRILLGL